MSETDTITIKITTDDLPLEFKFFLYALLWTISTLNMWMYIKICKNLFTKNRNNNYNYESIENENN